MSLSAVALRDAVGSVGRTPADQMQHLPGVAARDRLARAIRQVDDQLAILARDPLDEA